MITCDQALELISASLDLPLTTEEQQMLDQHLDGCPECRALLADFQKIHQELLGYKRLLNGMDYLVQDLWTY